MANRGPRRDGGYSTVELLAYIVVVIILLLIAIMQIDKMRLNARVTAVKSDVKQYATAIENYAAKTGRTDFANFAVNMNQESSFNPS